MSCAKAREDLSQMKRAFYRPHKLTDERNSQTAKQYNNKDCLHLDIQCTSTIIASGHPTYTTTAPIRILDCFKNNWIDSLDYSKIFYLF